jgi:protein-tyrosine phosphatase
MSLKNMTTKPVEHADRRLNWAGLINVRDLGGYVTSDGKTTRWKTLVRADNLNFLSEDGRAALRAYGVQTIVDLRYPKEVDVYPSPFAGEPHFHHLPLLDEARRADEDMAFAVSRLDWHKLVFDARAENVAAVMQAIAHAPEGAVLFHCHAGKDRTGIVAALLLDLAGVPHDVIAEDYSLSNEYLKPRHEEWLSQVPEDKREWALGLMMCPPDVMKAALDHLQAGYGSTAGYLKSISLSDDEISALRKRVVED